jgi:hypothetical protein
MLKVSTVTVNVNVSINREGLERDVRNLVGEGMTIDKAIATLPLGKYVRVTPAAAAVVASEPTASERSNPSN